MGIDGELTLQQIGAGKGRGVGHGGGLAAAPGAGHKALCGHQAGDALAAHPLAAAAQLDRHAQRSVAAPGLLEELSDDGAQLGVAPRPGGRSPVREGVVGGPGDLQQRARPGDVALRCSL